MNIVLGKCGNKDIKLDVDLLLRTRLLIQANSGGGKSYLLRRIAEQLFGKVQVIIIDPEGEFPTLREKYGYVLVGHGGETPADVRSAGLVAEKLLELNASAVCDIFEAFRKNPQGRHAWVKAFCNAMLDAPRTYWHPVVLIIDEFHKFCPEKGAGESEASEAVIGIGTAGRKRGYCLVGATQRLGKVRKDVSAELLNRLVGPTFEDVDLKRAAELLSVLPENRREFFEQMRVLEPGNFFALGRAICKERTLVKVGSIETSHPDVNQSVKYTEPPPTPEKVKALLPKLADLPQQAEEKVRTLETLSTENRTLKARIHSLEMIPAAAIVDQGELIKKEEIIANKLIVEKFDSYGKELKKWKDGLDKMIQFFNSSQIPYPGLHVDTAQIRNIASQMPQERRSAGIDTSHRIPAQPTGRAKTGAIEPATMTDRLTTPQQRIIDAIAWFESIGIYDPEQTAVAFIAKYVVTGGAYLNPRGWLRSNGLIECRGDKISLTDAGRKLAFTPDSPLTTEELHNHVMSILPAPAQKILKPLLEVYPQSIQNADLAEAAGYAIGGAFNNPKGRLRSLGLIEYLSDGSIRAKSLLFVR